MSTRNENDPILHDAILAGDAVATASHYRVDAVLTGPAGRFEGREQIAKFFEGWFVPFSDAHINEWYRSEVNRRHSITSIFSATHTGPLVLPSGESLAPTGKRIALHAMEYVVLDENDEIAEHRLYYDQVDLMGQLGLEPRWVPQ